VNRTAGRTGALFEGRFRSCIVDSQGYFLRCQRYIEMNPVRAKMVAHPAQYPWSSYRVNAEGRASDFVVPHPEYGALGSSDEQRRERYRSLFDETISAEELRTIREAINGGLVLGREPFIAALQECFARKAVKGKGGRPRKVAKDVARST
jgi:putative transposase